MLKDDKNRCPWAMNHPLNVVHHDLEWGIPEYNDILLFERFSIIGAHVGVGWITVLRKRFNFREAFDDFDPESIARYGDEKIEELLENKGIIRNRQKIKVFINNAQALLKVRDEVGSFHQYIWRFVNNQPIQNHFHSQEEIPQTTPESDAMSASLKKRGFQYAGSRICYAFMQSVGMVNNHLTDCWMHDKVNEFQI